MEIKWQHVRVSGIAAWLQAVGMQRVSPLREYRDGRMQC